MPELRLLEQVVLQNFVITPGVHAEHFQELLVYHFNLDCSLVLSLHESIDGYSFWQSLDDALEVLVHLGNLLFKCRNGL